jgi:hypothetical protein
MRGGVIDRRADLFSCGSCSGEALVTKRLFKGDGEAETLNRVLLRPDPAADQRPAGRAEGMLEDGALAPCADVMKALRDRPEMGDAPERRRRGALECVGWCATSSNCPRGGDGRRSCSS